MITIYKTRHCPYCIQVQKLCERYKVKYDIVELDDKPALRDKLIRKTGMMTVPITTDGKTYIAGWQPGKLVQLFKL